MNQSCNTMDFVNLARLARDMFTSLNYKVQTDCVTRDGELSSLEMGVFTDNDTLKLHIIFDATHNLVIAGQSDEYYVMDSCETLEHIMSLVI